MSRGAALCLIESYDRLDLLAVWNEHYSGWSLPGGKIERDETPAYAAMRELREETGLVSNSAPELIYVAPSTNRSVGLVHVYRVGNLTGEIRCETESRPVKYMSWEAFLASTPWATWYRTFRMAMTVGGSRP